MLSLLQEDKARQRNLENLICQYERQMDSAEASVVQRRSYFCNRILLDKQNHWPLKGETCQRQISGRESMGKIEEIIEPHEKQIIRPKIQLVNMKPCI